MKNKWQLWAGLGLGLIAAVLVNVYLSSAQRGTTLLRFKQNMARGDALDASMLAPVRIPKGFEGITAEAISADDGAWVIGKQLAEDVSQGQILLFSHVAPPPEADFDKNIEKGKRALALATNAETGVGGLVEPGSYVDVIATLVMPNTTQQPQARLSTRTILQKVKVLAVGSRTTRSRTGTERRERDRTTSVVLELTPAQVEKVIFAQQNAQGPLVLSLTNPGADSNVPDVSVSWESFDETR